MSDFNSSLPVRTETSGDVAVKLVDGTVVSQAASVSAAGALKVDGSAATQPISAVALPLPTGAATEATLAKIPLAQASSTASQFGELVQGAATTAAPTYTTGTTNPLSLTLTGAMRTDASATTQPISAVALPLPAGAATEATLAKLPISQGSALGANSGVMDMGAVSTAAPSYTSGQISPLSLTPAGALRVDSSGYIATVNIQVDSAAVSKTNAMPVYITDSPGVEVNDYNTASAIAAAGTSNHDYTVTAAKTFRMSQILASASGKLKIEIQVETGVITGIFTSKFVMFNSASSPNIVLPLNEQLSVAAGVRVRLIRTNLDKSAEDVYSTMCGHEQ